MLALNLMKKDMPMVQIFVGEAGHKLASKDRSITRVIVNCL